MINEYDVLNDRQKKALQLRDAGVPRKLIAKQLGVTIGRVYAIIHKAEMDLKRHAIQDEWHGLPVKIRNILDFAGYDTREKIIDGIKSGSIHPYNTGSNRISGIARKSYIVLCKWAGIEWDEPEPVRVPSKKTIKRYVDFLARHGYESTKIK